MGCPRRTGPAARRRRARPCRGRRAASSRTAPAAGATGRAAGGAPARCPTSVDRRLEDHRAVLVEEEERRGGGRLPLTLAPRTQRSEEHTSELQSRLHLVCRLLL